jgi:hypothetical protein
VVSFTPRPLYSKEKLPLYLLNKRLCGPQNRYGRFGEEKTLSPLPGYEPRLLDGSTFRDFVCALITNNRTFAEHIFAEGATFEEPAMDEGLL